jgi:predicted amidohydrolase
MRAAVLQLSSQQDLSENLRRVGALVDEASGAGAEFLVLPENFAFMGPEEEKFALAEPLTGSEPTGPIGQALGRLAEKHGVWIVGGGMPERSGNPKRPFNSSVLWGPSGKIAAVYRKLHLFDVELPDGSSYRESNGTSPGDAVVTASLRAEDSVQGVADATAGAPSDPSEPVTVGMTICYDLRFPELFRQLTGKGARVITVPAAFTLATGKDHWHALLRARAIENQVFVLAAAQHGKHPLGRQTYGKSLIVDPWGDILAQCSDTEGFALARLDFRYQDKVRTALPCLGHRRL